MKRISFIAIALLLNSSLFAQQKIDLTGKPQGPIVLQPSERRVIEPGSVLLKGNEIDHLKGARPGTVFKLPSIDNFTESGQEPLQFKRVDLYARDAQIMVVSDLGSVPVYPGQRQFFLAANKTTAVGLAVNPETGAVTGHAIKSGGAVDITGSLDGAVNFVPVDSPDDGSISCGTDMDEQAPDAMAFLKDNMAPSQGAVSGDSTITWQTEIAVDTDTEWMAGKSNSPTIATTWIEDLFLSMNVMFERDVSTRLLIGEVILRIGPNPDPYTLDGSNRSAALSEFGEYWRVNQNSVVRDFAAMLSGRSINSNSFSGIAWINQYCRNGSKQGNQTAGSYSYNAVGSNWSASAISKYIGHELGHNMGSPHTHCISNNSGGFVDECYNAEGNGCFSGATACPVSGKGTTMSYCHVLGGCGSTSDFHPVVQSLLEDRLANNSPSCISPFADPDPTPSMTLQKEISVDGGSNWFAADAIGTAPAVDYPSGAQYRLIVTNNGDVDLVNVTVSDSALGINNYPVGSLAIDATAVLDSGDIIQLGQAQVCNSSITFSNTASASGESAANGAVFGPVTDVAMLNCVSPPSLAINTQISVDDGTNWFDADTAGSAPTVNFPSGAFYRVTLNNNGLVDLLNVRLSISALGINNFAVGGLAAGNSVILDNSDIPQLNSVQVCNSATTVTTTASATGVSSLSGSSVGPVTDSATLNCIEAPPDDTILFKDSFE